MFRGNGFRVELDTMHRQFPVAQSHDRPVFKPRRHLKAVGDGVPVNHQRVVACCLKRRGKARKDTFARVVHHAHLAVHDFGMTHHRAAKCLPQCLMSQTDPHERGFCLGGGEGQRKANPGLIGIAGSGGQQDASRVHAHGLLNGDRIIAHHVHVDVKFAQIMNEIVGKAVVVIDEQQHGGFFSVRAGGVGANRGIHALADQGASRARAGQPVQADAGDTQWDKARAKSMARGVLSGAIWGTVLSLAGLGTLSVLEQSDADRRNALAEAVRDLAETPEPEAETEPAVEPAASETAGQTAETEVAEPATEPEAGDAPADDQTAIVTNDAPVPNTQPEPAPDIFEPVGSVEPGDVSDPVTRPADVAVVTSDAEAPRLAEPIVGTDANPDRVISTPIPSPETRDAVTGLSQPDPSQDTAVAGVSQAGSSLPATPPAPTLDTPEREVGVNVTTEPAQVPVTAEPEPTEPSQPAAEAEPVAEAENQTAEVDASETSEPSRPVVRQLVPNTPEPDAADGDIETAALARPTIGRPAGSLIDRNPERTSRLPTIGGSAPSESEDRTSEGVADDSRPPVQRYAARIDDIDPTLPRMAIVLLDDGSGPMGPDTLDNFPFPVTFALNPAQSGAASRMMAYRSLGYEVATIARLPDGAQPADVEQILAGALAAVPESVALVEAPQGGLQSDRSSIEQTAAFVADSGHGLVFLPNGLNTAEAIARRENVPVASVLRDFDGDGQDARTKRRFLDGAAFRARQDGSVVMLGRLTPDTVSALLLWSLQDRASSVAMVPISAILTQPSE